MNGHSLIDIALVSALQLVAGNNKYFVRNASSPGYQQHMEAVRLSIPDFTKEGIYELSCDTLAGKLDPAFFVAQWLGRAYPSLIYLHGSHDHPFNFGPFAVNSFSQIFVRTKTLFASNLIAVCAPFHNLPMRHYFRAFSDITNWMSMLGVSIVLIDGLVRRLREVTTGRIFVAGLSLGGFVTNLHRAYYNTADGYAPLLAGAAFDDVFLHAAYRRLTGKLALSNPDTIVNQLNFEEKFIGVKEHNVFPLLARFDQVIRYERQKFAYEGYKVYSINRGHFTGALDIAALRRHILWCTRET